MYYWEGTRGLLILVTVLKPWTEGVARRALEILIEGPVPSTEVEYGFSSPRPPTTEVIGIAIKDGLARVDLGSDFLDYEPEKERAVLGSVIYIQCCSFPLWVREKCWWKAGFQNLSRAARRQKHSRAAMG